MFMCFFGPPCCRGLRQLKKHKFSLMQLIALGPAKTRLLSRICHLLFWVLGSSFLGSGILFFGFCGILFFGFWDPIFWVLGSSFLGSAGSSFLGSGILFFRFWDPLFWVLRDPLFWVLGSSFLGSGILFFGFCGILFFGFWDPLFWVLGSSFLGSAGSSFLGSGILFFGFWDPLFWVLRDPLFWVLGSSSTIRLSPKLAYFIPRGVTQEPRLLDDVAPRYMQVPVASSRSGYWASKSYKAPYTITFQGLIACTGR